MVADQPLDETTLATAVGYPSEEVGAALAALAAEYDEQGRGFELRNVAGGWRFYTREEYAAVVEGFVLEGQQARLTQAALETLAVVAYKQPVSRARVSAIRGVNVDGVMRTLLTRGLVEEAGRDGEHGATLYRTTELLPGADRGHLARRPARAGAVPARHGRPRGRARRDGGVPDAGARARRPRTRPREGDRHRRRRPGPAAEAPGPVGGRLAPQVRGADARGRGRGRRRGRHPARHQGRPAHRGDPGVGAAAAADLRARLPGAQQAARRRLDDVRPRGTAHLGDVVADRPERLFHVGRLDTDTPGLLLLTNDGDFAQQMAHPSYEVDKTYVAEVDGHVSKDTVASGCWPASSSTTARCAPGPGRSWRRRARSRSSSW